MNEAITVTSNPADPNLGWVPCCSYPAPILVPRFSAQAPLNRNPTPA